MDTQYNNSLKVLEALKTVKFNAKADSISWRLECEGKAYGSRILVDKNTDVAKAITLFMPQITRVLEEVVLRG